MPTPLSDPIIISRLQSRYNDLKEWLVENSPECSDVQTHLDAGTPEQVYWNYGYAMALRDVLKLLGGNARTLKH